MGALNMFKLPAIDRLKQLNIEMIPNPAQQQVRTAGSRRAMVSRRGWFQPAAWIQAVRPGAARASRRYLAADRCAAASLPRKSLYTDAATPSTTIVPGHKEPVVRQQIEDLIQSVGEGPKGSSEIRCADGATSLEL